MNKQLALLTVLVLTCGAAFAGGIAPAEAPTVGTFGGSIAPELVIPIRSFNDRQGVGGGGVASLAYAVMEGLDVYVTSGYLAFAGQRHAIAPGDTVKRTEKAIPVVAGLEYYLMPGLHVGPELGYHRFFDGKGTNKFSIGPVVGYTVNISNVGVDLSGEYTYAKDFEYLGVRLGLRYWTGL